MSTHVNHWKLGAFVVMGFVLALVTILVLGARSLKKSSVSYVTFFDESVQGVEVGSPVKFRGVTVGTVSAIDIAQDKRHVAITSDLAMNDLDDLGLSVGKGRDRTIGVPPDLRMQLASQGITGVKFLQIDFFKIADNPLPTLPFPVPHNYIPAAVSTMKNLEDAVVHAVDRLPEVADAVMHIAGRVDTLMDEVGREKIPENTGIALQSLIQVLATIQRSVNGLHTEKLSATAQVALDNLDATIDKLNQVLARLDGDKGLVASVQRASNTVGDVASNARGLGPELETTLRDVQDLVVSMQGVADALVRDPDMLLKGRARVVRK
jgi:phospholipid/cholesterol/gamma-HCH transport system substrate-binding protein